MDHSEVKHLPKVDHTPAELDKPSRLLLKAAGILEQYGFVKQIREEPYGTPRGRHCLLGAIDRAGGHDPFDPDEDKGPDWWEAVARVATTLPKTGVSSPGHCANWNNEDPRTAEEVVAKLRAVALGL